MSERIEGLNEGNLTQDLNLASVITLAQVCSLKTLSKLHGFGFCILMIKIYI